MGAFADFNKTVATPGLTQRSRTARSEKRRKTAKDEKETTAALIAVNEMVLHELEQLRDHATNDLMLLVEQFVGLSLTESFSVQVAVRVLKQEYLAVERKVVDEDELERIKKYFARVKRKLELLNNAKVNGQGGVGNM